MKKRELADLIDTLAIRLARLEDDVRALQWKVASLLPPDAMPPQPFPQTWGIQQTGQAPDKARPSTVSSGQTISEAAAVRGQADGVDISSSSIEINRYDLYP